ncbi:hypothetical protein [Bacillus sp. JJ722]|uniref:hypothetical protein n=1 Tax=Bacillus sp. JJ722 TaxID=3122973 RepID=UPI002FFE5D6D
MNLVSLNGGNKGMSDLEKSLLELRGNLPIMLEYMAIKAQVAREYYTQLIAEGFTEQQAIELVAKDANI